jgi:hypothetical protein
VLKIFFCVIVPLKYGKISRTNKYSKTKTVVQSKKGPAGMDIFGTKKIHVIGKTGTMVTII